MSSLGERLNQLALGALKEIDPQFNGETLEARKSLTSEYGFDSIALIKFVTAIEIEFGIEIDEVDLVIENFDSLFSIKALLQSNYQVTPIERS